MIWSCCVAMGKNRVIGRDQGLPWHLPQDLKRFRDLTLNKKILMGRRTFQSIGKPLPNREHFIVSRDPQFRAEGVKVFQSLESAIDFLKQEAGESEEVVVVGGAEIYRQMIPHYSKLFLTLVDAEPEGDTYFPEWDWKKNFRVINETHFDGRPSFTFIDAVRTFDR